MASAARKPRMTPEEFFAWEAEQLHKHEYYYGEVFPTGAAAEITPENMAGGSISHALISTNAAVGIGSQLRGGTRRMFSSDLAVELDNAGHYVYPDLTVVCGTVETGRSPHVATNPTLVLEVLSPSTEKWDRGGKFEAYRRLPSLQTVVFVASTWRRVEVFTREGNSWRLAEPGDEGTVALGEIPAELSLATIYDGVDLPDRPPAP